MTASFVLMRVMTKRKPKKQKQKRTRTVPIQFYLSSDESAELRAIARTRGVAVSQLVRDWIRRSAAAAHGALREREACVADPRQLRIGDASFTVLKEATAESQFVRLGVRGPCCDSPLVHIGIHDGACTADE